MTPREVALQDISKEETVLTDEDILDESATTDETMDFWFRDEQLSW